MRISYTQLKRARVETVSGHFLGRVYDLILDGDGQLLQYVVSPSLFSTRTLLISPRQIISLSTDKIVVDNSVRNAVPEKGTAQQADVTA